MRFIEKTLCCACAALLGACAVLDGDAPPRATVAGTGAPSATVAGARPTGRSRDWTEYKLRAAQRIHQTSAGETFAGPLPDPLQSIPVLQVHLNRDGSVRDISVLRTPRQSPQTIEIPCAQH